jgi:hypothetical protein
MFERFRRRPPAEELPFAGWPPGPPSSVDLLTDEDLEAINGLLPWQCFTVDGRGRRLGDRTSSHKRAEPQLIPDPRIVRLDGRIGLDGTSVLELGCFEGVHTIGLCERGAIVTAIDARPENVVKTLARTGLYGHFPEVVLRDLEDPDAFSGLEAEVAHHVGVLYHLDDPVGHLLRLGRSVSQMLLDTHIAPRAESAYEVDGTTFEYATYVEGGRSDPFSGMRPTAKWLTIDALRTALHMAGFDHVDVVEERDERNGPRILAFASR